MFAVCNHIAMLFFFGFALSLIGSLPPGLISLTVAQTAIVRGITPALAVALGAAMAEFFQALIAVMAADWFMRHPSVERLFQWAAACVFLVLAIYFLFFAKTDVPEAAVSKHRSLPRQFLKGIVVSVFNLLAIPYWFVYCAWLRTQGCWRGGGASTLLFAAGVVLGTLMALGGYALLGQWIRRRSEKIAFYANRVVGAIFLGLGLKTLLGLVF